MKDLSTSTSGARLEGLLSVFYFPPTEIDSQESTKKKREREKKKTCSGSRDKALLLDWPPAQRPGAAILKSQLCFRPSSISNNRPYIWPNSPQSASGQRLWQRPRCFCLYSTMITVFGGKVFAFCPFFFRPPRCAGIDVSGFCAVLTEAQPTPKRRA